jgi:hypothetical protein
MNDREYNALTDKLNHANAEIDRLLGIIDRITESNENKDAACRETRDRLAEANQRAARHHQTSVGLTQRLAEANSRVSHLAQGLCPDGFVIAPVEPTHEMYVAAVGYLPGPIYRAMIAARPSLEVAA